MGSIIFLLARSLRPRSRCPGRTFRRGYPGGDQGGTNGGFRFLQRPRALENALGGKSPEGVYRLRRKHPSKKGPLARHSMVRNRRPRPRNLKATLFSPIVFSTFRPDGPSSVFVLSSRPGYVGVVAKTDPEQATRPFGEDFPRLAEQ